jgi:alkylation response protein AidB-like acyl-CoA dehydrogenase
MDLQLTEHQNLLKSTIRNLLARDFRKEVLVAIDAGHQTGLEPWAQLVATGMLGVLIPEIYGGAGTSVTDAAVVFEELGRGPVSGPHLSSGVLAALAIIEGGTPEQRQELLPAVATGERIVTLAITEEDYGWEPRFIQATASRHDGELVLDGTKLYVHDAGMATNLIVAALLEDGGIGLALVAADAPGVSRRPLPGFATGLYEVRLEGVRVPESALVGGGREDGWNILDRVFPKAITLLSAYQVGGLAQVYDMSLEYSRTRHQFQQPIGRFQRVQDHVIDILNKLDEARWTTYEALWKLDTGREASTSVHMAAAVASEAYYLGCNSAHDVHAGVGIMREYGLTLHTKMSRTLYHYLGGPRYHRKKLAQALGL